MVACQYGTMPPIKTVCESARFKSTANFVVKPTVKALEQDWEEMHNVDLPSAENTQREADRAAAFSAEPRTKLDLSVFGSTLSPLARNALFIVAVTLLVLGLVGGFAEAFVGDGGISNTFAGVTTTIAQSQGIGPGGNGSKQSLFSYMGLKRIVSNPAHDFTLVDQHNSEWSLKSNRGKVVVVTFYSANCQDICPVLGREIKQADSILGTESAHVAFVIVNTDLNEATPIPNPPALTVPGLENDKSVYFLNGTLADLDRVWSNYGVTIDVRSPLDIYHNNVMYFITPMGRLAYIAIPFGNENRVRRFGLPSSDVRRFAKGIALIADRLIK